MDCQEEKRGFSGLVAWQEMNVPPQESPKSIIKIDYVSV